MKLLLNNFWGRYAMQSHKSLYKVIVDLAEWIQLVSDSNFLVTSADCTNKKYLQVQYKNTKLSERSAKTNLILVSFVTAYARIRLLKELRKFEDSQIIYYDSDSVFFSHKPGQYIPNLGNYLGELTSEIKASKGNFIQSWCSGGPKNYSYVLDTGYSHAVIKSISLNHTTTNIINLDSMIKLVKDNKTEPLSVNQLKFSRNVSNWSMNTSVIKKNIISFLINE